MRRAHHEIPTHLDVQDKLMLGLTVRQFLYLLVGASLAYAAWEQPAAIPIALRTAIVAGALAVATAVALLRPLGRPLEEWVIVALLHAAQPRVATWQQPEPDPADWHLPSSDWEELAPSLAWDEEDARR
jgi:hypothetical protein